jgi:hypothetical protein
MIFWPIIKKVQKFYDLLIKKNINFSENWRNSQKHSLQSCSPRFWFEFNEFVIRIV